MAPGIGEAILANRDEEAARLRAGEEYVAGFIEANEATLRTTFIPEDTPEEQAPGLLYRKVTEAWDDLAQHYTRAFGVSIWRLKPGTVVDTPTVKLGWDINRRKCFYFR
jgi:hypothetical protein